MTQVNTPNTSSRNTPNAPQSKRMDKPLYENERAHWKQQFSNEPYYESGHDFADYDAAYRIGTEGRGLHSDKRFEQIEPDLKREWEQAKGAVGIGWDKAKQAARAAWNRVDQTGTDNTRDSGH